MDKIGIVTITYNSQKVISEFLKCILSQKYTNFILYIVDNNSNDDSINLIKDYKDDRVIVIENKKNFGVAKANNQGIEQAILDNCEQVLLINNDVECDAHLLDKLLENQIGIKASMVAPKIMYYNKPNYIWYAGSWFSKKNGYLPSHRGINMMDKGQYDTMVKVDYAPTCCILINISVFKDIGLMDENYFVYFDDTDFLFRVFKQGQHKLYYCPDTVLYHKVGTLTNSFQQQNKQIYRSDFFIKQITKNYIYFLKKNGGLFSYFYIIWLFFRNNIKFIINKKIRKDFHTFILINKSYFEGLKM